MLIYFDFRYVDVGKIIYNDMKARFDKRFKWLDGWDLLVDKYVETCEAEMK